MASDECTKLSTQNKSLVSQVRQLQAQVQKQKHHIQRQKQAHQKQLLHKKQANSLSPDVRCQTKCIFIMVEDAPT